MFPCCHGAAELQASRNGAARTFRERVAELAAEYEKLEEENLRLRSDLQQLHNHQNRGRAKETKDNSLFSPPLLMPPSVALSGQPVEVGSDECRATDAQILETQLDQFRVKEQVLDKDLRGRTSSPDRDSTWVGKSSAAWQSVYNDSQHSTPAKSKSNSRLPSLRGSAMSEGRSSIVSIQSNLSAAIIRPTSTVSSNPRTISSSMGGTTSTIKSISFSNEVEENSATLEGQEFVRTSRSSCSSLTPTPPARGTTIGYGTINISNKQSARKSLSAISEAQQGITLLRTTSSCDRSGLTPKAVGFLTWESSRSHLECPGLESLTVPRPSTPWSVSDTSEAFGRSKAHHTMGDQITLIPQWYDPDAVGGMVPQVDTERQIQRLLDTDWQRKPSYVSRCVVSPFSSKRLCWDVISVALIMYNLWSVLFTLIFVTKVPEYMRLLGWIERVFFTLDLVLNFFTGYIEKDGIVLDFNLVAKKYMMGCFGLDLVATFPWDLFVEFGSCASVLRLYKVSRVLKTLQSLKLVRVIRVLEQVRSRATFMDLLSGHFDNFAIIMKPLQALSLCLMIAHLNGCIWVALQPDWTATDQMEAALNMYLRGLWWAYMAFTVGSLGPSGCANQPDLWVFEIVVASQRLCVFALVGYWFMYLMFGVIQDTAQLSARKSAVWSYLRQRDVSVKTQIQVLYNIQETQHVQHMQENFKDLVDKTLPRELRRSVFEELWCQRLMSLGLLMHVGHFHPDLMMELAQLTTEEVVASKTILFKEGDPAYAAYCIMRGRLTIAVADVAIPDFCDGSWLGEKALVNPLLRRSATAISRVTCTLMVVPGDGFHALLDNLNLLMPRS